MPAALVVPPAATWRLEINITQNNVHRGRIMPAAISAAISQLVPVDLMGASPAPLSHSLSVIQPVSFIIRATTQQLATATGPLAGRKYGHWRRK